MSLAGGAATRDPDRAPPARGPRRWLTIAVAILAAAIVFLYLVRPVLTPFLLAAALAYLVDPLVEALHRRGMGRPWAILATYACVGLAVAGLLLYVLPGLIGELERLSRLAPAYARRVQRLAASLQRGYRRVGLPTPVRAAVDQALVHLRESLQAALRGAVGGLLGLFGGLVSFVLAPVLAYYLLADLPRFRQGLLAAVPPVSRPACVAYLEDLDRVVSGFVRGQVLLAASVGLLVALAMWLLGVRFALTLGVLAGMGELVPYFGPVLGALPALALGALGGTGLLFKVVIALVLIQQLESAVLAPKIVAHTTGLHPLTVIFGLLAGGHFAGVAGLILAVPVLAVLKVTAAHGVRLAVVRRR